MFKTASLSEAVIITSRTGISPTIQAIPFPTGNISCKVCFQFPGLSENYQIPDEPSASLSFSRLLLNNFEDYSRVQRCIQLAYRERGHDESILSKSVPD